MPEILTGQVVYTLADGTQYVDVSPMPCERLSFIVLDQSGVPFGLVVDGAGYRIVPRKRLPIPPGGTVVYLGRRVVEVPTWSPSLTS